ncbi:MAG: hypothetical protein KatS3mg111_0849 [Pirellulaceae bacterium]|nr:MAG: hypothetical protein KatS3mg111_0849 [Pirellulaceae bacterium]
MPSIVIRANRGAKIYGSVYLLRISDDFILIGLCRFARPEDVKIRRKQPKLGDTLTYKSPACPLGGASHPFRPSGLPSIHHYVARHFQRLEDETTAAACSWKTAPLVSAASATMRTFQQEACGPFSKKDVITKNSANSYRRLGRRPADERLPAGVR